MYYVQEATKKIVGVLEELNPRPEVLLDTWFSEIVAQGTGRDFEVSDNENWTVIARPMLEAFFHARYFLQLVVRYAAELESSPPVPTLGMGAVLYLYGLR